MFILQMKMIVLNILGLIRRALCCFSRRRKSSYSEPITNIIIVDNNYNNTANNVTEDLPVNDHSKISVERDWHNWDDSPRTIQEHIEQYRQRLGKPTMPLTDTPEPDYFKELTPVIQPQMKFYLRDAHDDNKTNFSRLEAKTDVPITLNADLEDWMENDGEDGWEEMDTREAKQLLREQRRQKRYNNNNNNNRSKIIENFTNTLKNNEMNFMTNSNSNNNNNNNNNHNVFAIKQLS